jgi:hypothetical protein
MLIRRNTKLDPHSTTTNPRCAIVSHHVSAYYTTIQRLYFSELGWEICSHFEVNVRKII